MNVTGDLQSLTRPLVIDWICACKSHVQVLSTSFSVLISADMLEIVC